MFQKENVMNYDKIIEPIGFIIAVATMLFSFLLFYSDTGMFLGSLSAAALATGLAWISYVILRWIILAIREK
jgi:hypothetical protein